MASLVSVPDPDEVPDRVRQLFGFGVDVPARAVRHGFDHASTCTGNDVRTLAGTLMWAKSSSSLRDDLVPEGWKRYRVENQEGILSPDKRRLIIVTAGNQHTGRFDGQPPQPRYPRGVVALGGVKLNTIQGSMFPGLVPELSVDPAPEHPDTWWLLHYWDRVERQLRAELARPMEGKTKGSIVWDERLPVPVLDIIPNVEDFDFPDDEPDIDFPVTPRN